MDAVAVADLPIEIFVYNFFSHVIGHAQICTVAT